ncbi:MAG TPA: hypothetical protein VEF03_03070 [Candidatus Binataceae bacterium]|nr:hypothetical protein [Candidatus Binataceae bacterium]
MPIAPSGTNHQLVGALRWILWLIPFGSAAVFIARYGVDVPYVDQWGLPWLFAAAADGHGLGLQLRTCINEHPVLFPKLVWLATAFATKWNTRADMAVNLAVLLVTFIAIERIVARETSRRFDWIATLAVLVIGVVMFSLVDYDGLLFGACLPYLAVDACVVFAIWSLLAFSSSPFLSLAIAWSFCIIASYSSLQGMLSWLVMVPCVVASIEDRRFALRVAAATLLVGVVVGGVYLIAFIRSAPPTDHSFSLHHPIQAILFFVALIGAPLAQTPWMSLTSASVLIGLILVARFSAELVLSVISGRWREAAPWISIGTLGLGFAAMISLGRSEWGLESAATSSRYMSTTSLIAIAVIGMWRRQWYEAARRRVTFAMFAGGIAALSIVGSITSIPIARGIARERRRAAAYLELVRYIDPATDRSRESPLEPLEPLVEYIPLIRPSVELAAQLGFRKVAMHVPFIENPPANYGWVDRANPDGPQVVRPGDYVYVSGWAIIPTENRMPKFVVITTNDARLFISAAWLGTVPRADVAAALENKRFKKSGWGVLIPAKFLPPGESTLHAWAYDDHAQELVRLEGGKRVIRSSN